jgi:hypothetical protein
MNNLFMMTIGDFLPIFEEAIELAKSRGKKEGENFEQEFFEVAKRKEMLNTMKHLGQTQLDKDMLTGELRDKGLKILNLDEIERRKQIEKDES